MDLFIFVIKRSKRNQGMSENAVETIVHIPFNDKWPRYMWKRDLVSIASGR